jgi:hypothetical protein
MLCFGSLGRRPKAIRADYVYQEARFAAAQEPSIDMSDIAAGDIVECIDDTPARPESQVMPDLGALYTVASIRPAGDGLSVRLRELTPSCHLGGVCACGGCGWDAGRFRKIHRPRGEFIAELLESTLEEA